MEDQKNVLLGKPRPSSARPRRISIPEKTNEQLQCIKRDLPTKISELQ